MSELSCVNCITLPICRNKMVELNDRFMDNSLDIFHLKKTDALFDMIIGCMEDLFCILVDEYIEGCTSMNDIEGYDDMIVEVSRFIYDGKDNEKT